MLKSRRYAVNNLYMHMRVGSRKEYGDDVVGVSLDVTNERCHAISNSVRPLNNVFGT